jgi:hypothetical protein
MAQLHDSIKNWMDSHEWPWQIGTRLHNVLDKLDIHTLGDLLAIDRRALLRTKNMGKKSMNILDAMLAKDGLRVGWSSPQSCPSLPPASEHVATLRDQFAMAALTGMLTGMLSDHFRPMDVERAAELAFETADAMIRARKVLPN